jgi:creatinine amidohydrolase
MIWDQLTSEAIGKLDRDIPVVLPIAATEQHGYHLPVATDRMIGEHLATGLDQVMGERVLVLPVIGVGCSDHHMDFPGSLTLSHETFARQVKDIVGSVIHHGFRRILLLNSHGGNQGIGQVLVEQLGTAHPDCHIAMASWWKTALKELEAICESGPGGVGHACEIETSLMLLIAPELVVTERIEPKSNIPTFDWAEGDLLRAPIVSYFRTLKEMAPNGVYGEPEKASAEKGQRISDCVVKALQGIISDLAKAPR